MYENLTRLDLVGPALARALGDPGWEQAGGHPCLRRQVEPDLRAEQRRGRGGAAQAARRAAAAAGARHGPGGPGAAGAGGYRRAGGAHPARGRRRPDRRALLRDGEGRRVRHPRRPAAPGGPSPRGAVRRRRRPDRHAGRPARHRPGRDRPVRLRPALRAWGSGRCAGGATSGSGPRAARSGGRRTRPACCAPNRPRGPGERSCTGTSGSTTACWASRCRRRCRPCWTGSCPPWGSRWPTSACSCSTGASQLTRGRR